MAKYIILDTETTGVGEEDRIIQLGFMVLESGKQTLVYNEFCSCERAISIEAMEVHGITEQMLEGRPSCLQSEAYMFLNTLNTPDNYLIIHNAPFDLAMLKKEGFECKMQLIDTLRCAKHIFDSESAHRLQYFRYRLELYKDEKSEAEKLGIVVKAHDAIGDVLVLKLFLSKLRQEVEKKFTGQNPIEKMVELTKESVFIKTPIRFGKHRGKTLMQIRAEDEGYLRWALENMESLDDDMRYSIKRVLES